MLKRAINIETIFTELPFYDRFQAVKDAGFDYVEFWGWENKDLDRVNQCVKDAGLILSTFSGDGPFSMCDPTTQIEYINYITKSIEVAKKLNCHTLVIHSDALEDDPPYAKPLSGSYSYATKICSMYEILKSIAPLGEGANITFVLEALNIYLDHIGNFLHDTKTSADLIHAVHSPNVKILYDAYHMYLDEGKLCETTRDYIKDIGYIHIADAPGRHEPGTGAINYNQFMNWLAKIGYPNVVGYELFPETNSAIAIQAIHKCSDGI